MSKLKVVQVSESAFSVQGHGVHTAFVETVRGLGQLGDVEVLQNTFARADIRHIHTFGAYGLAQLVFPRGKKVVSAHVVPASLVGSIVGAKRWLAVATRYLRWFYNRADLLIAVSDETKRELEAMGVRTRIDVIYNMVDTSQYVVTPASKQAARRTYGIAPDAFVVIGNGQVQPRKRVDTFVAMARALPDMTFVWVGGMPFGKIAADSSQMQQLIDTAPANVTFTGVVSLDEVRQYLACGDVFVMTSQQETFGLAIVEAAASGLPVVLRDLPDYDRTFRPDAVMCSEGEFVPAVSRLGSDAAYYQRMKTAATRLAARYDSRVISRQLAAAYQSLL